MSDRPQWEINHTLRWAAVTRIGRALKIRGFYDTNRIDPWLDNFAQALGYRDWEHLRSNHDEELNEKLRLLDGPNAVAIWHAIKARREND